MKPTNKIIKRATLVEMFKNFKKEVAFTGCSFMHVTYFTNHADSRTVKGKKVLQKITRTCITVGSEYQKKVNKILEKKQNENPDFVAQEMKGKFRPYGYEIPIVAATSNPDFEMLCAIVENHTQPKSVLYHEGKIVSYAEAVALQLFTPAHFLPKQTTGRGRVDEENDFHFITLGFDKILKVNINKQVYKVVD